MMDSRLSALARAAFSSENLLRGKGDPVTIVVDAMARTVRPNLRSKAPSRPLVWGWPT